jgi:hypothetical protein
MQMNELQSNELKQIVSDVLGAQASKMFLGQVVTILDEKHQTVDALKNACAKIERMVSLFHGSEKARLMRQRMNESLSRAGVPLT